MTVFAERLRAVMGAKRVTMREMGAACGVSAQAVQKWVDGECYPSSARLVAISRSCGCSIEWLMHPEPIDWKNPEAAQ